MMHDAYFSRHAISYVFMLEVFFYLKKKQHMPTQIKIKSFIKFRTVCNIPACKILFSLPFIHYYFYYNYNDLMIIIIEHITSYIYK